MQKKPPSGGRTGEPLRAAKVPAVLALFMGYLHVIEMRCNFSVFRERLAEACHVRDTTPTRLAKIIGLSPRRIIDPEYLGAKAMDIHCLG
jgi:hypothetical protein